MKKLLLTVCTAALFSIAAIAQEKQDTIPTESNQLREIEQEETTPAEEAVDSVSTDFQESVNETEREAEEAGEKIREESQNIREEAEDPDAEQDADSTLNQMNEQFKSTVEDPNQPGRASYAAPELEVVEGKEGPDNQVVYKYQGELFYVDREEKKLVKAKESDLQDAEHEVIIKEGGKNKPDNEEKDRKDSDDNQ